MDLRAICHVFRRNAHRRRAQQHSLAVDIAVVVVVLAGQHFWQTSLTEWAALWEMADCCRFRDDDGG